MFLVNQKKIGRPKKWEIDQTLGRPKTLTKSMTGWKIDFEKIEAQRPSEKYFADFCYSATSRNQCLLLYKNQMVKISEVQKLKSLVDNFNTVSTWFFFDFLVNHPFGHVKFRIFVMVSFKQTQWKKLRQIFEIWNSTHLNRWANKDIKVNFG